MGKRVLLIFLVTAAVAIAALSGYWVWWAGQLERGIAQWREQQRARGYEISYQGPALSGFPLAHVARFEAPSLRAPDGASWQGPAVVARAPLWDPRRIALSVPGRHLLEGANAGAVSSVVLDSREAEAVVRVGSDGRLASMEVAMRGLEISTAPFGPIASDRLDLRLAPSYETATGRLSGTDFAVEVVELRVPAALAEPLEPTAGRIAAVGRLDGVVPAVEPRLALAAWRDNGGALAFESLEIDWPPLGAGATGRLVLDDRLRPQGELAAQIAGLPALLDRLAEVGRLTPQQASNTKLAVLAFAGAPDANGRRVLAVPVILQAGILYLGPIPLGRVSPVL
jgi:hypothetical protein